MVATPHRLGHQVGRTFERERQRRPRAGQRLPYRGMRVVGREDRRAVGAQRLDHRSVLAGHRLDAGHEFLVLALGVVDQRDRRRGHARELGDLADVVHAQLDDRRAVPGVGVLAQPQQRERHADVVVEVALGRECRVADPGAQDARDHLRHGGLAVAAGHGDQRQAHAGAPVRAQRAERGAAVGHVQPGQAGLGEAVLGDRRHCAGGTRLRQEVVRVEALALERNEQVTGAQRAGIAVHAQQRRGRVADERRARQQRMRQPQVHHHAHDANPRAASACRASATSENGCLTPAISW
ncbi:hypothetical protein X551_04683 [Methylibium sp. T29]|nr:hypothetical protein X551_04683 [Methylibium sp. T29]